MHTTALVRRTHNRRIDCVFEGYRGDRSTFKLCVAMPIPSKLSWSTSVCDHGKENIVRQDRDTVTVRAMYELPFFVRVVSGSPA